MTGHQDVLVIGNAILDIIARCDEAFLQTNRCPKGRMNLVASSHWIADVRAKLESYIEVSGGSAANTAVGIASLGGRATFIGKVAEDESGRIFRHDIRAAGVRFTTPSTLIVGKETSRSLILVTPDGTRTMNTFLGCGTELGYDAIDPALVGACEVLLLEGYLLDRPAVMAAFRRAILLARGSATRVALSLPDSSCVERHRGQFLDLIRSGIHLLVANEREIMSLYQTKNFDDAVDPAPIVFTVITRIRRGYEPLPNVPSPEIRFFRLRQSSAGW